MTRGSKTLRAPDGGRGQAAVALLRVLLGSAPALQPLAVVVHAVVHAVEAPLEGGRDHDSEDADVLHQAVAPREQVVAGVDRAIYQASGGAARARGTADQ